MSKLAYLSVGVTVLGIGAGILFSGNNDEKEILSFCKWQSMHYERKIIYNTVLTSLILLMVFQNSLQHTY